MQLLYQGTKNENDQKDGKGVEIFPGMSVGWGHFRSGQKHGTHIRVYKNGDLYTGTYLKGKISGEQQVFKYTKHT